MKNRTKLYAAFALLVVLSALGIGAASLVGGSTPAQDDATQQQQTIDAVVSERFTQTAVVQQQTAAFVQQLEGTQTAEAAAQMAPTLTAVIEATIQAEQGQVLTATAGFQATIDAQFNQILTATAQAAFETSLAQRGLEAISLDNAYRVGRLMALKGASAPVRSVVFSPDGLSVIGGDDDGVLHRWDVVSGDELWAIPTGGGMIRSVAISPGGELIATGSKDGAVRLWDFASGTNVNTLADHQADAAGVSFSPDGKLLASGSADKTIVIRDVQSGTIIQTLSYPGEVLTVAFSSDSQWLLAGGSDKAVHVFHVQTWQPLYVLTGSSGAVSSVAINPVDKIIAAGSRDNTVRMWYADTGERHTTLKAHTDYVMGVAFNPDSYVLASAGRDGLLILWNAATGEKLVTLNANGDGVLTTAFSPDGALIASGGRDNRVILWYAQPEGTVPTPGPTQAASSGSSGGSGQQPVNPTPLPRTPHPDGFPTDVFAEIQGAEEVFEHGRMFWIRHNQQIWVMVNDPSLPDGGAGDWYCYADSYQDGEPETDPSLVPPDGLYQPRRGFGKVWREKEDFQTRLGWATTPEFDLTSTYTYIAGGAMQNGQYVPGPGEHRLTTLYGESISFFEQDIRGDCLGGTWSLTK